MKRILRPLSLVFILSVGCLSIAGATEYDEPRQVCVLSDERIDESSGLEVSASGRAVFYTHNDDEGDDRLFVFDATGATVGVHRLRIPTVKDWEDLSTFLLDEQAYILCADVGNNSRKRGEQLLYIVKEPPSVTGECELASAGRIQFSYDEGNRDCEAVAVDVPSGRILLATKEREPETSGLYELPLDFSSAPILRTAKKLGPLGIAEVTSMDISRDGLRAVILAYEDVWELRREQGQSWGSALKSKPKKVARLPRGQWEAACYGHDNRTIFVTKEKLPALLLTMAPLKPEEGSGNGGD